MAATCATCLRPIVQREKFVLSGTEVFHARCAMASGTTRSVKAQLDQTIVELTRDAEMLHAQLDSARREVDQQREISRRIARERDQADSTISKSIRAHERSWQRRFEETRAERDRFEVERDHARRELAVLRQYPTQVAQVMTPTPATPVATANPEPAKDERDASEIRFSLLEIDGS